MYKIEIFFIHKKENKEKKEKERKIMSSSIIRSFSKYIEHSTIDDSNTLFPIDDNLLTCLISSKIIDISIDECIRIILKSGLVTNEHLEGTIIYAINILNLIKMKGLYLNNLTCHRLVIISLLLASKLYDDQYIINSEWSRICGIPNTELNKMESNICKILNFNLFIIITPEKSLYIYNSLIYSY